MKAPSSTITATAIAGGLASLAFGLFAIFAPERYALVPAGMEAGMAVLIAAGIGYLKRENRYKMVSRKNLL